jgi:hypothetical protein
MTLSSLVFLYLIGLVLLSIVPARSDTVCVSNLVTAGLPVHSALMLI